MNRTRLQKQSKSEAVHCADRLRIARKRASFRRLAWHPAWHPARYVVVEEGKRCGQFSISISSGERDMTVLVDTNAEFCQFLERGAVDAVMPASRSPRTAAPTGRALKPLTRRARALRRSRTIAGSGNPYNIVFMQRRWHVESALVGGAVLDENPRVVDEVTEEGARARSATSC